MQRFSFLMLAMICLFVRPVWAQLGQNKESSIQYEKEWSLGAIIHTHGYGGNLQFTRMRNDKNFQLIDINIYSIFHPKEISLPNPDNQDSRAYVFGKLNNFIGFNAGYGSRMIIADRWITNSIRVNFNYSIGPVAGLLKPVYYEIQAIGSEADNTFEKFDPDNTGQHARIIGTEWTWGWGEITFLYGLHAKSSLSFEWGNNDTHFYSLETGVLVDAFPVEVPIFAYIKNQRVFPNLFLTLSFGKRH